MRTDQNVLLLMIDALRADRVWGDGRKCVTPVLDSLKEASLCFTNAFSTASMTTCCTATILTGTYPFEHGVRSLADHRLRSDLPTLAEAFREAGYFTWAEVTGPLLPQVGLNRGFEAYRHRGRSETLDQPWRRQFLERLDSYPQPWFGMLHLWELHHPRRVTPQFDRPAYGRNQYDRAVSSLDHHLGHLLTALPEQTVLILTADHGEYVAPADRANFVGKLKKPLKWLRQHVPGARRLKRLTPAVFTALDRVRGEDRPLYYQWLGHGFHVYDYLVRVPLMFYGPDIFPANLTVEQLTSHVDLLPTLSSAFQLPLPGTEERQRPGVDLMPLVENGQENGPGRTLYLEASGGRTIPRPEQWLSAVRTERYKYVRGLYSDAIPEELYDLEQDPAERHNLAGQLPEITNAYRQLLAQTLAAAAPGPEEDTAYSPAEQDALQAHLRALGYLD